MKITPLPSSHTGKVTVPSIRARKGSEAPISVLTAYDYTMARLLDEAGVDIVLVGDSLGAVIQGEDTTIPVTLDQMIYHSACVAKGVQRALVVTDMPFMSYQVSVEKALESAFRILKEGRTSAVKVEGGVTIVDTIRRMIELDIPVMGHIGLTPQSYHRMGGYKVQGFSDGEKLIADAKALDEAGVFSIVLEGIPNDLAAEITEIVSVPTIGIGAGPDCDGQVLVTHDLLGMQNKKAPKFVRQYAQLSSTILSAVQQYIDDVQTGAFPSDEFSYGNRKKDAI